MSDRGAPAKVGDLLFGSWPRTLAALLVALLVFALVGWLALSGALANTSTWNIPLIHPYPPPGYYLNPLASSGQPELVNAKEAAQVRNDFLADGQLEVDAFTRGDPSQLATAETGNYLVKVRQLIVRNNTEGVYERAQTHIDKVQVGLLVDPNQPDVRWCVRETGDSTISFVDKSSGRIVREQRVRFDSKYWLVKSNGRYLITDNEIVTQSGGASS